MQPERMQCPGHRPGKRKWTKLRIWNMFVMGVGYAALAYLFIWGVVYLLVLANEWVGK